MHTAEHILNQTMDRMFGCGRCFSAHIERKKSKCDYHMATGLTDRDVDEITDRVNEAIEKNMTITECFVSRDEAKTRFNIDRLPEDTGDSIRIIGVGDYDACPCIGDHVVSTGDIGRFKITSHGFKNGILRIRYKLDRP